MSETSFDSEKLVDAMASLHGLTLTPESRAQVILHLQIAARHADLLLSAPLADEAEPAPVFTA
jgi:hypothetical protein